MAYDSQEIFGAVGALIFVIDAQVTWWWLKEVRKVTGAYKREQSQDDYTEALHRLFYTVTSAYRVNQNITFEVLIHKVDGLSDDYKIGNNDFKGMAGSTDMLKREEYNHRYTA